MPSLSRPPLLLAYLNCPALYKGATRVRTVDVSVDGAVVTTWSSSGTTTDFETVDLSGHSGQDITITGVLADLEWLSIVEVSLCGRLPLRKIEGESRAVATAIKRRHR